MTFRGAALSIFVSLLLMPQVCAQAPSGAPAPHPGQRVLERLSRMTPEQRERALAQLPPARRQRIEQSLRDMQNLPPAQQNRLRMRLELLNSLPPQRQVQVRRSVRQFLNMPAERKAILQREMWRMAPLRDDERQLRLKSEELRGLYSPRELQMMRNLMAIQPQP